MERIAGSSLACLLMVMPLSSAFVSRGQSQAFLSRQSNSENTRLFADMASVRTLLSERYPQFEAVTAKNDDLWKKLSDAETFTLFCPSAEAFASLGDKRLKQLQDPRNLEAVTKLGLYHAVNELVTPDELFDSGGVITLGGEIPVDRSVKGGFFGVGGTEDGGVLVGGCKVTESIQLEDGFIHEVDGFVSPQVLWRYMDQLRIPGSS